MGRLALCSNCWVVEKVTGKPAWSKCKERTGKSRESGAELTLGQQIRRLKVRVAERREAVQKGYCKSAEKGVVQYGSRTQRLLRLLDVELRGKDLPERLLFK